MNPSFRTTNRNRENSGVHVLASFSKAIPRGIEHAIDLFNMQIPSGGCLHFRLDITSRLGEYTDSTSADFAG